MKNKKGQAAMEFLTTYGWAFLVIIVVIAGLYYMDVFDFSRALPTTCSLDHRIECGDAFSINENGEVALSLKNNLNENINITGIKIVEKALYDAGNPTWCEATPAKIEVGTTGTAVLSTGSFQDVDFDTLSSIAECGISANAGKHKMFKVQVMFTVGDGTIESAAAGTIGTTVIEVTP
ncbi:MAG: hypothetical protein PHU51_04320 [Candidatus Nanoarchaeia archaeon]|nr:hypothetical protein [Candidatus Nanoarchaeia archaeon]